MSSAKGMPAQGIYFNCTKYGGELRNQSEDNEWLKEKEEDAW